MVEVIQNRELLSLEKLLDEERKKILLGDVVNVSRLASQKEALLSRLGMSAEDAGQLSQLRAKADRNRELLEAAIRGIRNVTQRLEFLRRGQRPLLTTYDQSGQSQNLGGPAATSLEKKA
ncbi:flagellar biosynthesis protein FlgN [Pseudohalocynthiibacter aestuariivivens]|jgi:flagellar biosynthesis/type III secretory pathway chaperone|uniref:Flagellar biosynthesis protein FlgN n=1 Tax=Pseudohalocynthiibacter aestuariivivens TaxID=1591409 RepID=A0ABV5JMY6_9RHOB|nr:MULTISPECIES: hypothetical protein [Pseudohalocynthiibacter]MBS9717726.1 hypothetical protein [Pseudohalocynthiibacter aestuariivivens]MCK0102926.1 hypothetical protein [Pseudohalocynthiibacter sp. F2068]